MSCGCACACWEEEFGCLHTHLGGGIGGWEPQNLSEPSKSQVTQPSYVCVHLSGCALCLAYQRTERTAGKEVAMPKAGCSAAIAIRKAGACEAVGGPQGAPARTPGGCCPACLSSSPPHAQSRSRRSLLCARCARVGSTLATRVWRNRDKITATCAARMRCGVSADASAHNVFFCPSFCDLRQRVLGRG